MNNYAYFILHYKKNIDRRDYIFEQFITTDKPIHWITNFDREEIVDYIDEIYQFNEANWYEIVGGQLSTLIGHRVGIGRKYKDIPWALIFDSVENLLKKTDRTKIIQEFPQFLPRRLKTFELSLLLKHRAVYQQILANNYSFGIVLEDDFILSDNSINALNKILTNKTLDWDFIDIAGGAGLTPRQQDEEVCPGLFSMLPPRTRTTCGYLISNRLCKDIINLNIPPTAPCDWELTYFMQQLNAKAYWTMPTVILHGSELKMYQSNNN